MNPSPYPAPTYRAPFTSAHTRAGIVKVLLIIGAVASALLLLSEALTLAIPPIAEDQEVGDNPAGLAIVLIVSLLALLNLAVYVATVIFFAVWLYRSYANLPAFGASKRGLGYSPGWAVGSFFIPFVNLIVPYRAIKELWQKSTPPDEALLAEPSPPAWFHIWWLFWLLASFASNISFRLSFNERVSQETSTIISVVAGALSIIAAVLAYLVVDDIYKKQEETSQKLKLGKFSGPPVPPPPPSSFNVPVQDSVMPQ